MDAVVVCEPQCIGFEHAEFNAALLRTAQVAFPSSPILFAGENDHVSRVRARIEEAHPAAAPAIEWVVIDVPRRHQAPWQRYGLPRLRAEGRWCAEVRRLARARGAGCLILASLSPSGLLRWKRSASAADPRALAFLHGVVARAYDEQGVRAALLRAIFRMPAPSTFRYVALGDSIREALREADPRVAERFAAIDIPSLWATEDIGPPASDRAGLRFGYFGVSRKGFDTFAAVAAQVRARHPDARFGLVGFLNQGEPMERWRNVVEGLANEPLTTAEYARRAREVTYAVWAARPREYRLAASASFVDAIAFGKPSIVLRNRFAEHYFDRLGDIGYLCDSVEEVTATVESIARAFPEERYRAQLLNLQQARRRFAPDAVAPRLAGAAAFSAP